MEYTDIRGAVMDAYRQRDYARCFALLELFTRSAQGESRGRALCLMGDLIAVADRSRCAEGLALIDEALCLLQHSPEGALGATVTAVGLCIAMGDPERSRHYEERGYLLMRTFGDLASMQRATFRLHLAYAAVAHLREEYATAYWHAMHAVNQLQRHGSDDGTDIRHWFFTSYIQIATACRQMGRRQEAQEALGKAAEYVVVPEHQLRLSIERAGCLRASGGLDEAARILEELGRTSLDQWHPALVARFHLERALVDQALGDRTGFQYHIAVAGREAAAHALDFLLPLIQRAQRETARAL